MNRHVSMCYIGIYFLSIRLFSKQTGIYAHVHGVIYSMEIWSGYCITVIVSFLWCFSEWINVYNLLRFPVLPYLSSGTGLWLCPVLGLVVFIFAVRMLNIIDIDKNKHYYAIIMGYCFSFISDLHSQPRIIGRSIAGVVTNSSLLAVVAWMNHMPPVQWSSFSLFCLNGSSSVNSECWMEIVYGFPCVYIWKYSQLLRCV